MRSPTAVMAVVGLLLVSLAAAAAASSHSERERIEEEERRVMGEWLAKHGRSCREGSEEEDRRLFAEWKAEWEAKHGKKYRERSEKETRFVFAAWMAEHGKKYKDAGEEMRRYAFFKDTLRRMDQYEAVFCRNSVIFGYNGPFSDLSHEWRAMSCGMLPYPDQENVHRGVEGHELWDASLSIQSERHRGIEYYR
ncbi:hypothetical protein ACQ4PT_014555 [Festuca glaucescens]